MYFAIIQLFTVTCPIKILFWHIFKVYIMLLMMKQNCYSKELHNLESIPNANKGWVEKKFPNVLLNNSKLVNPAVKAQAKDQNYFSIALKWGILCLSKSNGIGVKKQKLSIYWIFAYFAILHSDLTFFLQKCKN